MPLPALTAREHEVAARECDTVADYLDELASYVDGPHAAFLARAHRSAAQAVRARAARHRDPGVIDPPQAAEQRARDELYNRNAVTIRNPHADQPGESPFIRLP